MSHLDREKRELETAPLLFSDLPETVRDVVENNEALGEWTGERLWQRDRKLYEAIVRMMGAGFEIQTVAELLGVSDNTVRAVRERETSAIAEFRSKQGVKRRRILNRLLDRIEEKLPEAELKDAVIAYGILDDKERLDSGAPTQVIHISHAPATEVYEQYIKQIIDVQAVTVPATGLQGQESAQMREGAGGAASPATPATGLPSLPAPGASADIPSADLQRSDDDVTGPATDGRNG